MENVHLVKEVMCVARNWMERKKVLIVADYVWDGSIAEVVFELDIAPECCFLFTTRIMSVAEFTSTDTQFHFSFAVDIPGAERSSATLLFDCHLGSRRL